MKVFKNLMSAFYCGWMLLAIFGVAACSDSGSGNKPMPGSYGESCLEDGSCNEDTLICCPTNNLCLPVAECYGTSDRDIVVDGDESEDDDDGDITDNAGDNPDADEDFAEDEEEMDYADIPPQLPEDFDGRVCTGIEETAMCWTLGWPAGLTIYDTWASPDDVVVFVGEAGLAGFAEQSAIDGTSRTERGDFQAVDGIDYDLIWAVGPEASVYGYDGEEWTEEIVELSDPQLPKPDFHAVAAYIDSESDFVLVAGGSEGIILVQGNDDWVLVSEHDAARTAYDLEIVGDPEDGGILVAVGADGDHPFVSIYPDPSDLSQGRTDETLESFGSPQTPVALRSVWGVSPDAIWAVGDEGTVLFYDGSDWSAVSEDGSDAWTGIDLNAIEGRAWSEDTPESGPIELYIAGEAGAAFWRGPNLSQWNRLNPETSFAFHAVGLNSRYEGQVWLMGEKGSAYMSTYEVADEKWVQATRYEPGTASAGSFPDVLRLAGTQGDNVYFVDSDGAVWTPKTRRSRAVGIEGAWKKLDTSDCAICAEDWGDDATDPVSGKPRPKVYDIWMSPSGVLYAASDRLIAFDPEIEGEGRFETVISKQDAGGALYAVWGRSDDDVYAVGERLFHFDGESWTELTAKVTFPDSSSVTLSGATTWLDVWGRNDKEVWLLGMNGKLAMFGHSLPDDRISDVASHWQYYENFGGLDSSVHLLGVAGLTNPDPEPPLNTNEFGATAVSASDGSLFFLKRKEGSLSYEWTSPDLEELLGGATIQALWSDGELGIVGCGTSSKMIFWNGSEWVGVDPGIPQGNTLYDVWGTALDAFLVGGEGGALLQADESFGFDLKKR